jgi:uncharacterized protein (DUF1330 family)
MHIDPTHEQAEAFGEAAERPEPVFMLNLLRFKEGDGAAAYGRYAAAAGEHVERVGGSMVWLGVCDEALIGPQAREWDAAAVVRYPSRQAFLEMVRDRAYQAIVGDRTAGLVDSRLIPCAAAPLGA